MLSCRQLRFLQRILCIQGDFNISPDVRQGDQFVSEAVKLSDFKGKVVIVDFWATWCPPCRAEIPDFIALQDKYGKQGLVIVGISVDQGGAPVVASFAEKTKINYQLVLADDNVAQDYGVSEGIPTTFVIDRKGNIIAKHLGETAPDIFEKEIKSAL